MISILKHIFQIWFCLISFCQFWKWKYWNIKMFELTHAQRAIANKRVSLFETMISMATDKLFRTFWPFIFWKFLLILAFLCFYNYHCSICIFNNGWPVKYFDFWLQYRSFSLKRAICHSTGPPNFDKLL